MKDDYLAALELTGDPQAASLFLIAEQLNAFNKDFDHVLAMGIRKGLFGANAHEGASVDGAFSDVSDALLALQQ